MANATDENKPEPQDDRVSGSSNCYAVDHRPTWRERIRYRLFPHRHCFAPEAPATYKDCVSIRTVTVLSWADRLRIMLTGRVVTETRTVTEHEVGNSVTNAVTYVGTKYDDIAA